MKRRNFLLKTTIAGAGISKLGALVNASAKSISTQNKNKRLFSIGICTDLHHDLIKDGPQRLQAFIDHMNIIKPDFILQMGDFCVPKPQNQPLMDIWNQFKGNKYHAIGNHDIDGGFTHDQVIEFWNAKGKYYSFDYNGYHFVVLNGNERQNNSNTARYPNAISPEQRQWLINDLDNTMLPAIVVCHQGIDNDLDGLKEATAIRLVFERANKKAGFQKVQLVLSGHHHEDYLNVFNGINYLQINSMAYQFAHLKNDYAFALTAEPLWAVLTVYDNGIMELKGKRSEYRQKWDNTTPDFEGYPTVPYISDRVIKVETIKNRL